MASKKHGPIPGTPNARRAGEAVTAKYGIEYYSSLCHGVHIWGAVVADSHASRAPAYTHVSPERDTLGRPSRFPYVYPGVSTRFDRLGG